MEESGKEECNISIGIGVIADRQDSLKFQNGSEVTNDILRPVSIFEDHAIRTPERRLNENDTVKRTSSNENDHVEELTSMLQNHHVENKINGNAEVVKDVVVREELDQTCSKRIPCNGNVSQTVTPNHIENICVGKEENITFKKDCGKGGLDSVNHEMETTSLVLKTNESNNYCNTATFDFNVKTENIVDEKNEQERGDALDIRFRVISGESQETCQFCAKDTTKVNDEPPSVTTKDLNTEVMETTSSEEPSCIICALKSSNKRKLSHDPKSENVEKTEVDLIRSASRISDTSSNSNLSGSSETKKKIKKELELETDPGVLYRRQKQIEYGKNTTGYERYRKMVPKDRRTRQDPQTPPKCAKYSRRAWDGLIKAWRRKLHNWDPPKTEESDDEVLSTSSFPTNSDESENLNDLSSDLAVEELSFAVETETNGTSNNQDSGLLQIKEK